MLENVKTFARDELDLALINSDTLVIVNVVLHLLIKIINIYALTLLLRNL